MDFVKRHYEKIVLSVVLLGLLAAVGFMLVIIPTEQQKVKDYGEGIFRGKVVPIPDLDMTAESNVVIRLQSPYVLDFDITNKLFNPVEWQRTVDGKLMKATGAGPQAAVITGITPLYFILTLDSVETNELGVRYVVAVERQASPSAATSHRQTRYASLGEKKDIFTITSVKGAPENPDALIVRLADTGETVTLTKDKPFRRVDGYSADLRYDPEKRNWSGQRVGSHIRFAGDDYTVVDIRAHEVVLSAQSNQRKWTLRYTP
jgi:hypothetical protein